MALVRERVDKEELLFGFGRLLQTVTVDLQRHGLANLPASFDEARVFIEQSITPKEHHAVDHEFLIDYGKDRNLILRAIHRLLR